MAKTAYDQLLKHIDFDGKGKAKRKGAADNSERNVTEGQKGDAGRD